MIAGRLKDAEGRTPGNHFDMKSFSLIEKEPGSEDCLVCSVSHYLPGGGGNFGPQPVEIIFFVLEGEMTIESDNGEITLSKGDALHISQGENKGVKNKTCYPASMLVIGNFPKDFAPPPPPANE